MAAEKPQKVHSKAKVGIDADPTPDAARLIGRRGRLLAALERADGERADSLRAELARIDGQIEDLRALLAKTLAGEGAGEE
jgi:hypothetical protein